MELHELSAKRSAHYFRTVPKASFNVLAHIFDTWPYLYIAGLQKQGLKPLNQKFQVKSKRWGLMRRGILWVQKKTSFGSSKPLIVASGELWLGCLDIVILQPSNDSTVKLSI
jgi:hypothetical protein